MICLVNSLRLHVEVWLMIQQLQKSARDWLDLATRVHARPVVATQFDQDFIVSDKVNHFNCTDAF